MINNIINNISEINLIKKDQILLFLYIYKIIKEYKKNQNWF